jgi:hypothetical protein
MRPKSKWKSYASMLVLLAMIVFVVAEETPNEMNGFTNNSGDIFRVFPPSFFF